MERNMGFTDSALRIVGAIAIFGLGYYFGSWWGAIGIILLITGIWGFCPLYKLLGVHTLNKK
jgi:hypothetical protein